MGFWDDVNDNFTGFFGGSSAEKARKNRERVNAYKGDNKPLPSVQKDLNNQSALTIPGPTSTTLHDLVDKNTYKPGEFQSPTYGNKMLSDDADRSRTGVMDVNPRDTFMDDLLGKITADWSGPDKSKIDYSPLDAALNAKLGALNNLRDNTNQNYDKSDLALEQMHNALQNNINTQGAQNFNNIADTQKQNLNADTQQSQQNLQNIKAEDMAKRQAMLKNLGIEAAGAAPDPSADVLSQAQGSIASRNDANVVTADQNRGTNLAFNQGIANSVGQAGVERRSDLTNQLQNILGRIGMSEADAKSQDAQARFALEQNAGNQQYQQYRDQKGFYTDTLHQMQQDEANAQKLAMDQQAAGSKQTVSGFAGLGQDLMNTGYDPKEVQNAMGILSNITSGDYMQGIDPNAGYDKASILNKLLQRNGVTSPMLALQLATNYANLGNVSKYQQTPY